MDLWVVKYASRPSKIGDFSGRSSARGAMFPAVLASRTSEDQGGLSAQGLPDGIGNPQEVRPVGID